MSSSWAFTFDMAEFHATSLGAETACRSASLSAWSEARMRVSPELRVAFGVVPRSPALVLLPDTMVVLRPAAARGARSARRTVLSPAHPMPVSV